MITYLTDDILTSLIVMMCCACVIALPTTYKFYRDRKTPIFRGASVNILLVMSFANIFLGIIGGFILRVTMGEVSCSYIKPWLGDLMATCQTLLITLKLWRIYTIFNNKNAKATVISDKQLMAIYIKVYLLVFFIPKMTLSLIGGKQDVDSNECAFRNANTVKILYSAYTGTVHTITLLVSLYFAFKTRKTPALINESDHLFKMTLIILVGTLVYQGVKTNIRSQMMKGNIESPVSYQLLAYFYWSGLGTVQLAYCALKLHFKKYNIRQLDTPYGSRIRKGGKNTTTVTGKTRTTDTGTSGRAVGLVQSVRSTASIDATDADNDTDGTDLVVIDTNQDVTSTNETIDLAKII